MKFTIVASYQFHSGYESLTNSLAQALHQRGHTVTVLGVGYGGLEHVFPWTLIPCPASYVPQAVYRLHKQSAYDCLLFVMDIPNIVVNLAVLQRDQPAWLASVKTGGVFPVESDPVSPKWAKGLAALTQRFPLTSFGFNELQSVGLDAVRLPYGPATFWYEPPSSADLDRYPILKAVANKPFILTVAKNQHRKNLVASMEIAREAIAHAEARGESLTYVLVTDPKNPEGWDLQKAAVENNYLPGQLILVERSILSAKALRALYFHARAFLLTSLAEGIGLPVYEAQAQGCPVVATNCCAIPEAVRSGALIDVDRRTPYPWGDTHHYWVDVEDGVKKLEQVLADAPRVIAEYPDANAWGALIEQAMSAKTTQPNAEVLDCAKELV